MINKSYSSLNDSEAIKGMSSFNMKGLTVMGLITQAFSFIIAAASIPLRLFLRDNLGERTIKPMMFLIAIALHIYYFTIFDVILVLIAASVVDDFSTNQMIQMGLIGLLNPYFIFLVLVIRKGIKHYRQKIREAVNHQTGYTFYRGDSKYFASWAGKKVHGFTADDNIIRMIVEPKAVLKLGFAVFLLCTAISLYSVFIAETENAYALFFAFSLGCTGLVLVLDAICLFIDELSLFLGKRDKVLDTLDGQTDMLEIRMGREQIEEGRKLVQAEKEIEHDGTDEELVSL